MADYSGNTYSVNLEYTKDAGGRGTFTGLKVVAGSLTDAANPSLLEEHPYLSALTATEKATIAPYSIVRQGSEDDSIIKDPTP